MLKKTYVGIGNEMNDDVTYYRYIRIQQTYLPTHTQVGTYNYR